MTLDVEINYESKDFAQALKWFSLAFKGKEPGEKDTNAFNKIKVLVDSMKKDEAEENES